MHDDRLTSQTWTDMKIYPGITQHLPPEFNTAVAASTDTRCHHHLVHGRIYRHILTEKDFVQLLRGHPGGSYIPSSYGHNCRIRSGNLAGGRGKMLLQMATWTKRSTAIVQKDSNCPVSVYGYSAHAIGYAILHF